MKYLKQIKLSDKQMFFGLLIVISLIYGYNKVLFERPVGIHQWRSCVSAAFAHNEYMEGDYLKTKTNALLADNRTSDTTIVEFPLIYNIVALLYKLFGPQEFLFRLVNILIGFLGLFTLFKTSRLILNDRFYAFVIPLLIFTSPIYVFYLNNFIPDAAALSLSFIGIYFFFRFYYSQQQWFWYIAMFFLAIAGLVKTASLLFYFAIGFILFFNLVISKRHKFPGIPTRFKYIASYLLVLLVILSWYTYARIYSNIHEGDVTVSAVEIRPIWELSNSGVKSIWNAIVTRWFKGGAYHSPLFLMLTLAIAIINFVVVRKKQRLLILLQGLLLFGATCFTLAFFRSMKVHDYYQICNLIVLVFIYLTAFSALKNNYPHIFNSRYTKLGLAVLVVLLINDCRLNMNYRYSVESYDYHWSRKNLEMYGELTPYLRSLGIEREDIVYCSPDPSINISLYLIDQKGYTDFRHAWKDMDFAEKYETMKANGLEYVIIGDTAGFTEKNKVPFSAVDFGKQIGKFGKTGIYSVQSEKD